MSSRYTEFVATNDIKDIPTRVLHVQRYVMPWKSTNYMYYQFTTHLDLVFTTNISHPLRICTSWTMLSCSISSFGKSVIDVDLHSLFLYSTYNTQVLCKTV